MCLCASVCSRNMVLPVVCDNRNCYTDTTVDISWIEFILALHFPAVQLLSLHSHVDNVYSHPLLTTSFMFPFLYTQDTGWILLVFHTCIYLHPYCQQTDTNIILSTHSPTEFAAFSSSVGSEWSTGDRNSPSDSSSESSPGRESSFGLRKRERRERWRVLVKLLTQLVC